MSKNLFRQRNLFRRDSSRQRPLLSLPQVLVMVAILAALFVALDLNQRARKGETVGVGAEALQEQIAVETTRRVELEATLSYVESDDYVADYARDEGGYLLPQEKRVVPLVIEAPAEPTPIPAPTPDPAANVQPWQAWWQLLTDMPQPTQ